MIPSDWLILSLIFVTIILWISPQYPYENFETSPRRAQLFKYIDQLNCKDPLRKLYKDWDNGGVEHGPLRTYNIPSFYPPASVKYPCNTMGDQLTCKDYAKRSCFEVRGNDRHNLCVSGQYDSCMEGRKRLIWEVSQR